MLILKVVLFLAAATGIGFALARFVLVDRGAGAALEALAAERDRLRLELESARRQPPAEQVENARIEHLRSAVHAAKRRIGELEQALEESRRTASLAGPGAPGGGPAGEVPALLDVPDGPADDLKRINGIGPGIEQKLNRLGIFHIRQIAALTEANVIWLEQHVPVRGRIQRQDWIGQARALEADDAVDPHPALLEVGLPAPQPA